MTNYKISIHGHTVPLENLGKLATSLDIGKLREYQHTDFGNIDTDPIGEAVPVPRILKYVQKAEEPTDPSIGRE